MPGTCSKGYSTECGMPCNIYLDLFCSLSMPESYRTMRVTPPGVCITEGAEESMIDREEYVEPTLGGDLARP